MDIVTHALVGAATGAPFGRPLLGAGVAVLPDCALWLRPRLPNPPALYKASHSVLAAIVISLLSYSFLDYNGALTAFFAWLSHIAIDIPTHGEEWSPRVLWPYPCVLFKRYEEWEWFNKSWWNGLALSFIWSVAWLLISAGL